MGCYEREGRESIFTPTKEKEKKRGGGHNSISHAEKGEGDKFQ